MTIQELNLDEIARQRLETDGNPDDVDLSSLLVDDLPCAVLIFDRDLNIAMANSFAKSMMGQATHLRHLKFYESGQHETLQIDQLPVNKVFETGGRFSLRGIEFNNPMGERMPLILWSKPFETGTDGQVEKVLVVVLGDFEVDLSGRLRQARLEAEAAVRAKNHFLANISHELRTPLNGIMGFLQLVIMGENMMPEQLRSLNMALDSAFRLQGLMDAVLEIASIEAGELKLIQQPYNLRELIADIDSTFSPQAELKGLKFKIKVSDQYHELIGDRDKVRQVVVALVDNAIKFTETGSINLDVCTTEGDLTIHVADTGSGIREEQQGELFEAFHQQLDYQSVAGQAMGLGLKICKSYVQLMGGHISFESQTGEGSAFHVKIPVTAGESSAVARSKVAPDLLLANEESDEEDSYAPEEKFDSLRASLAQLNAEVRDGLMESVLSADPSAFKRLLSTSGLEVEVACELNQMMDSFRYDEIIDLLGHQNI